MISFKTIVGFLFLLLLVTIAALAVVCYRTNEDQIAAALKVEDTHNIIEKADEILTTYQAARLAINSMIINHDTSRYPAYIAATKALPSQISEIRTFTIDNNAQQANIDSVNFGLQQFKIISDSLIELVRGGYSGEMIRSAFLNSSVFRANLTLQINRIKNAEKLLLVQQQQVSQQSVKTFKQIFVVLLTGISLLLISTFFAVRYYFNKRQKIQEELTRTKILFEKVFYESPIGMIISEFDTGKILNCNRAFANTVNYEISELLGRTSAELGIFTSAQRQILVDGIGQVGMSRHMEEYIKARDRDLIYVSIHAHVVPLYDGRKCLLTAILDLTSHKNAQDEVKKALETEIELNKLKNNFVTLASHEFRTPLATIQTSSFLVENFVDGEYRSKATKHLARIKSAVSNLTSILDEFLSITKIEEGRVHPNLEKTDLPNHIKNICNNLQTVAKAGQIIHYDHTGESMVDTDPVMLESIVNNLVSNSIKYSPENSPIYVTSLVNSRIHLTVKDEGIGIPEADQKYLFERFYRASNAGTVQGTGLGLHIMKHYVQMLKGSVKLKSKPGDGTQVDVTFDQP